MSGPDVMNIGRAAEPMPPRYWWLKRLIAAWLIMGAVFGGFFAWFSRHADRRWDAMIQGFRDAGQPILAEDFHKEPLLAARNAAPLIRAAREELSPLHSNLPTLTDVANDMAGIVHFLPIIASQVDESALAFCLLREAADKEESDWGIAVASPMINTLLPQLSPTRELSKALAAATVVEHLRGNDWLALDHVRVNLRLSEHVFDRRAPTLINQLVSIAISAVACASIEEILPVMRIVPDESGDAGGAPVSQVRALIAMLLDDSSSNRIIQEAMYGERAWMLDGIDFASRTGNVGPIIGAGGPWGMAGLLRPVLKLSSAAMLERVPVKSDDWKAGRRADFDQWIESKPTEGLPAVPWMIVRLLTPSLSRAVELHERMIAIRRMAATALAIRLFMEDHHRIPTELDELVPAYLPAVPLDPFAEPAGPIRYIRDDFPRLYSIGEDGVDDGAVLKSDSRGFFPARTDEVFLLLGSNENETTLLSQFRVEQSMDGDE